MIFDLANLHLGDVLMAMPAMRRGDSVVVSRRHRFEGAPVAWLDVGHGVVFAPVRGQHATDAWLAASEREPVRHRIMPAQRKSLVVIAPSVVAEKKRWSRWGELERALPGAVVIGEDASRDEWMRALNQARTVVCPDTGTAHMADALGCPNVIALHGVESNWPRCAPYWNRSHCVVRGSMEEIQVEDVLERVNG